VIEELESFSHLVSVNLMGNHEKALLDGNLTRFSTERGKRLLEYTSSILTDTSWSYIKSNMNQNGFEVKKWKDKHLLFLHGDRNDTYWGKLGVDKMTDRYYTQYDIVISGHTHIPHNVEYFYPIQNPLLRNKKKTIFINPGSVGQPRNQNPCAQYVYMELTTGLIHHNAVRYDIETERKLYPDFLDMFYKDRLVYGV
jgi:predicted phosphodiesterase